MQCLNAIMKGRTTYNSYTRQLNLVFRTFSSSLILHSLLAPSSIRVNDTQRLYSTSVVQFYRLLFSFCSQKASKRPTKTGKSASCLRDDEGKVLEGDSAVGKGLKVKVCIAS